MRYKYNIYTFSCPIISLRIYVYPGQRLLGRGIWIAPQYPCLSLVFHFSIIFSSAPQGLLGQWHFPFILNQLSLFTAPPAVLVPTESCSSFFHLLPRLATWHFLIWCGKWMSVLIMARDKVEKIDKSSRQATRYHTPPHAIVLVWETMLDPLSPPLDIILTRIIREYAYWIL